MTSQLVFRRPALANAQAGLLGETIKTIPELIHFHARANPDYVFCMQSDFSGDGQDEEFRDVTYADLEKAVLACQASIVDTIGQTDLPKRDGQGNIVKRAPIALLMESDLSILLYLFSLFGLGIPVSGTHSASILRDL
jgi:acyl-CoA synthetase (AMP-forming)/AMP-acid ligase II